MSKYTRTITQTINGEDRGCSLTVDIYDVLRAFNVTDPAIQHAIKKLLCTGIRGHKDTRQDLEEAIQSIHRALDVIRAKEAIGKPIDAGFKVVPDSQLQVCPFSVGDVVEHYDRAYSATKWQITGITKDVLIVVSDDPYKQPSYIERQFWRNYRVVPSFAIDSPQPTC